MAARWRSVSSWWSRLETERGRRLGDVCNFDGRWTVPWSYVFFDTESEARAALERAIKAGCK